MLSECVCVGMMGLCLSGRRCSRLSIASEENVCLVKNGSVVACAAGAGEGGGRGRLLQPSRQRWHKHMHATSQYPSLFHVMASGAYSGSALRMSVAAALWSALPNCIE